MTPAVSPLRIDALARLPELTHIFIGRAPQARPDPEALAGRLEPAGSVGLVATLRQVHSSRCLTLEASDLAGRAGRFEAGEGDALATRLSGVALGVATADCVPLVAVDPEAPALAVIHAGWRGTLAGALGEALGVMTQRMGARPDRIHVGAGPAAGPCCYVVGQDVIGAFRARLPRQAERLLAGGPDGSIRLDLIEANRLQALRAGVAPERFSSMGICTICRPDLCHSYRRDGASAGRMWMLAALRG